MVKLFFDLDETLILTQYQYHRAKAKFLEFMVEKVGSLEAIRDSRKLVDHVYSIGKNCPPLDEIIKSKNLDGLLLEMFLTGSEIDLAEVKANPQNPYPKERFPNSLRKTYESLCRKHGLSMRPEEGQYCYDLGTSIWNVKPSWVDGAEETLSSLKLMDADMSLLTAGDEWLQRRKIEINNLRRFFEEKNLHIVKTKENGIIESYLNGHNRGRTYMVGDSIRSDINPATKAGIHALYIPGNSWAYENEHPHFLHPNKVRVLKNIGELKRLYSRL